MKLVFLCSDDSPSHTEAISSLCTQGFCANKAVFHHGMDVVAIAMVQTIDKKADAAELQ